MVLFYGSTSWIIYHQNLNWHGNFTCRNLCTSERGPWVHEHTQGYTSSPVCIIQCLIRKTEATLGISSRGRSIQGNGDLKQHWRGWWRKEQKDNGSEGVAGKCHLWSWVPAGPKQGFPRRTLGAFGSWHQGSQLPIAPKWGSCKGGPRSQERPQQWFLLLTHSSL